MRTEEMQKQLDELNEELHVSGNVGAFIIAVTAVRINLEGHPEFEIYIEKNGRNKVISLPDDANQQSNLYENLPLLAEKAGESLDEFEVLIKNSLKYR